MIAIAHDLSEIDVAELRDDELAEAFLANMRKAEEIHRAAIPYAVACEQIIERLGRGDLAGVCRDCGRPLFERDAKLFYTATREFTCAPACPGSKPAPMILGIDVAIGPDALPAIEIATETASLFAPPIGAKGTP